MASSRLGSAEPAADGHPDARGVGDRRASDELAARRRTCCAAGRDPRRLPADRAADRPRRRSATRAWRASRTPPGLVALPPDVTLAAAGRAGLRDDLEVACWAAIAAAGAPPRRRGCCSSTSPGRARPSRAARAGRAAAVAARDRADRAGRGPELRAAARAPAAVDRARRAGRGRRRRRRLHLARVRRRAPPGLPQALAAAWSPASTATRAARPCCARPSPSPARSAPAIVAEGVERARGARALLRDAERRLRPGLAVRPPRRAVAGRPSRCTHRAPPRPAARAISGLAPGARARRAPGARDAGEACRRPPRAARADAERLPRAGRPAALPRPSRGYWQIYDGMPPSAGIVGRTLPHRRADAWSRTSPPSPTTCPRLSPVVAEVAVPLRVGGRVAGVLNAESSTPLGDGIAEEMERCAAALRRRLGALEPLDPPRRRRRWPARAVRLAALEDSEGIVRETIAAARELSGFESAMLARPDGDGGLLRPPRRGPVRDRVRRPQPRRARRDRAPGSSSGTSTLHVGRLRRARASPVTSRCATPAPAR